MSVQLDMTTVPDYVFVPEEGSRSVQLRAYLLDGMDRRMGTDVKWRLSETIDGFTPRHFPRVRKGGRNAYRRRTSYRYERSVGGR